MNPTAPTREEIQELHEITAYLEEATRTGKTPAEGSFTALINNASPNVKAHLLKNLAYADHVINEGGRSMPFEPARELEAITNAPLSRSVLDTLNSENLSAGLQERMGTRQQQQALAAEQQAQPPSIRELLEAQNG